jgi:hypothetical protein
MSLGRDLYRQKPEGAKPAGSNNLSNSAWSFNLKAVKALGLTIPPALLARADEVIE